MSSTSRRLWRQPAPTNAPDQRADQHENRDQHHGREQVAGAVRVEGGLTQESYFDFLDAVIRVLLSPKLLFVMEVKCWQEGKDFNDLVRRLKEFAPDAM